MSRWLPGPIDVFCVAIAAVFRAAHSMPTHDFWFHLSLGEQILRERALPTTDALSWTAAGAPSSVTYSWLTELLFAALEAASGLGLIEVAGALLLALTLRLIYATSRALGASAALSFVAVASFPLTAQALVILRPQLFTYLGLAWLFLAYVRWRAGESRSLLAAPAVVVVWTNLHGGVLIGIAFLAGVAVVEAIEHERGDPAAKDRERTLLRLLALAIVASCVNPRGPLNYADALENSLLEPYRKNIDEWRPPDLATVPLAAWVVASVALALGSSWKLHEAAALLASLGLALHAWRHVPFLPLVGGPVLAAWATRSLERFGRRPKLAIAAERVLAFGGPTGWGAIAAAFLVVAALELRTPTDVVEGVARRYPVAAVRAVRSKKIEGRMFNSYMWGGFLGWALKPEHPVYIDSRTSVFRDVFLEYLEVYGAFPAWRERLEVRGVDWAILEVRAPLAPVLRVHTDWRLVHEDDVALVFVRRGGPNEHVR